MDKKIIVLIDILGFSEFICNIKQGDGKEDRVTQLYEYLTKIASPGLVSDLQTTKEGYLAINYEPGFTFFSDTILMFYDKQIGNIDYNVFDQVLEKTAQVQKKIIELLGLLTRGCVHLGTAHYSFNGHPFFWGSGIVEAYNHEKNAQYPRVMVSNEAFNFYQSDLCNSNDLIKKDKDNIYYLNLLLSYSKKDAKKKLVWVNEEMKKLKKSNNKDKEKILGKWEWFQSKLNGYIKE